MGYDSVGRTGSNVGRSSGVQCMDFVGWYIRRRAKSLLGKGRYPYPV
jgi:hypothetical protein